jgi:hypothetical protein
MLFARCGATGLASPACALPQEHDPRLHEPAMASL